MHILVTGGTGFIGSALIERLTAAGHEATILTRRKIPGSPGRSYLQHLDDLPADTLIDAVVNLAGASLAERRWSDRYKREIFASRLDTTRSVLQLIERLESKPDVLLSASAIGYYGHHGDEILGEDGEAVSGFAQDLCQQWETLALQAQGSGVRVCLARLGVVLDRSGGAMEQMARPFRFGVANWLGSGAQWLSWVHRRDAVSALCMLLEQHSLTGPFNITAPEPVTSRGFCEAMKRHRKTILTAPVPAAILRLMVGEMAEELLLNGQRVVPERLLSLGFEFEFPRLDTALEDIV
jgi:uncharacterized protein (TIGR01777 family)